MKKIFFILLAAGLLTGCETMPFQLQTPSDRAALGEDQLIAKENQQRMAGRLETLEMEIGRISRDLETLRGQLNTRCAAIEQRSEADKREMVTRLSGELDKLIKQTSAPAPAPKAPAGVSGIEHVVRPGETLYIISKAYNVSTKTIMDANKMQDAGRLSVGQKLFIPGAK
ncbi:MAG: LysM domain-containing protein [Kiritimatiellales bacterium]|jgi:LysM repeat protein